MFPKINNKSLLDCTEEDLQTLIDNPDYRENEYIDYKKTFTHLDLYNAKKEIIEAKKAELKSDVCSFANAEGGYLIFGISDEKGYAKEIVGVLIDNDNTDQFELNIRNILNFILPKSPYIKFHFIKLINGKYVVILFIKHDNFAPYTQILDQKGYVMSTRSGNGKRLMTYAEVKNMFNQSFELEKDILIYRNERISHFSNSVDTIGKQVKRFFLFHIIPETFMDSSYTHNIFMLENNKVFQSYHIFEAFCSTSRYTPCIEGLRCFGDTQYHNKHECIIYNNGIVECYAALDNYLYPDFSPRSVPTNVHDEHLFVEKNDIWDKIEKVIDAYRRSFVKLYSDERFFFCITICGAEGIISEKNDHGIGYISRIDRNRLLCAPMVCTNIEDEELFEKSKKALHIEYFLSLGVKYNNELNQLIHEVYNNDTDIKTE